MSIRSFSILVLWVCGCASSAPHSPEPSSPRDPLAQALDAIEAHVRSTMQPGRAPGVALALTTRDGLAAVRTWGYADRKLKTPVTEDTTFWIASVTKSFTALALLQLCDEGRLDIDAPVSRYLPWFDVHSEFAPIEVVHLLTHTAGIPGNRDDITSSIEMARALAEQATAWAPGTRFLYSNTGYQVLHVLLGELSGEPYAECIARRFFAPLGMRHSRARITLEARSDKAVGYIPPYDDRPDHPSRQFVEATRFAYAMGDGCIESTAGDLAAYVRMWLNRGAGPAERIVSEATFERFVTPQLESGGPSGNGGGYALGVGVRRDEGHLVLAHSGGGGGCSSYAIADLSDGLGVVVLSNGTASMGEVGRFALRAWRSARAAEALPELPAVTDRARVENAADFAGSFADGEGKAMEFRAEGQRLLIHGDAGEVVLESWGEDAFYTPDPAYDRYVFQFGRDTDHRVVEVTHGPNWCVNERYSGPREHAVPAEWAAYAGRYRSYSPWFSYFEILIRKGQLIAVTGTGGENSSGESVLVPSGDGAFRVGREPTPESLRFEALVNGRTLRAVWSGQPFFREVE